MLSIYINILYYDELLIIDVRICFRKVELKYYTKQDLESNM